MCICRFVCACEGVCVLKRSFFLDSRSQPAHVTIFATSTSELNQRVVMDKVMSASGSKSHVM